MRHQYTPAPWKHQENSEFIGTDEDDYQTIAYVSSHRNRERRSESESTANAKLIASAPELLEALISLLGKLESLSPDDWRDYCQDTSPEFDEVTSAKKVISKALGG